MINAKPANELYLDVEHVAVRYQVSTDSIYRWKRGGGFLKAVKLSPGCVRWRLSDIVAHESTLEACFAMSFDLPLFGIVSARV